MTPTAPHAELEALGWGAFWEEAWGAVAEPGWVPGRVAAEDKHSFQVVTGSGEWAARVAGRLLHRRQSPRELPKVGDWVALAPLGTERKGVIHHVLPRRTQMLRKVSGRGVEEQVLAANVDVAFVVEALDATFEPRRLERFLVMAHAGGVRPVVVLNKVDLCPDLTARLDEAQRAAGSAPVVVACALTGRGVSELAASIVAGQTAVFVGASGVGKSSLINRLYGEEIQPTLEVRAGDSKGRHATTWREMIQLPGRGLVIDTPGMREFHLWLADSAAAFPDVLELAQGCRFRDCSHGVEEGCAVREAVTCGRLERGRYESYRKLRQELESMARASREHTQRSRQRGRGRPQTREKSEPAGDDAV